MRTLRRPQRPGPRRAARPTSATPAEAGPEAGSPPDATSPEAGVPDAGGCTNNSDCPPDTYCNKRSCGDRYGSCEERPWVCSTQPDPVCGCDGVSYLNDCTRVQHGASLADFRECTDTAARCPRGPVDCPGESRCALLQRPGRTCDPNSYPIPKCWGIPDCEFNDPPSVRFVSCSGQNSACVSMCDAIKSGYPHVRVDMYMCQRQPMGP